MNNITKSAQKILSCTLTDFIEAGGEILNLETVNFGDGPDSAVHVFACEGRDGTYTSDNAGVCWVDADFDRVVAALRLGDTSDLPESRGVASI